MIESHLYPGWMTSSPTGTFYPEFIEEDKQITLDTSRMTVTEIGNSSVPLIWIYKPLAYKLGWYEDDSKEQDPKFAIKLGPNLAIKLNGHEIPRTSDIKSNFTADGHTRNVMHSNRY